MDHKTQTKIYHLLARAFYLLGVVALLAGLGLSLFAGPVSAADALPSEKSPDYQLNLSHIACVNGQVEIHFVLLNVPEGVTPGNLTYTYSNGSSTFTASVAPGKESGNVWHYTDYQAPGYYNVTGATVIVGGVTVTLHNPGDYAGSHCQPQPTIAPTQPTSTYAPTEEPTPTEVTPGPTSEVTVLPPGGTPTPTEVTPSPTSEVTVLPPGDTPTPTEVTPVTTNVPPVSTETPIIPPTGDPSAATPDPGDRPSPVPTFAPPPSNPDNQTPLLIPVTGADQTSRLPQAAPFVTFLGITFLGLGFFSQGLARRFEQQREA